MDGRKGQHGYGAERIIWGGDKARVERGVGKCSVCVCGGGGRDYKGGEGEDGAGGREGAGPGRGGFGGVR